MLPGIDYNVIGSAQFLYKKCGFINVETPWVVGEEAMVTAPNPSKVTLISGHPYKALVGSAEQGFLQHIIDGTIEDGDYQSTGPCFRQEDFYNDLTKPYFLKTELISINPTNKLIKLDAIITAARRVLTRLAAILAADSSIAESINVKDMEDGSYDIQLGEIELGSYGIRKWKDTTWVYGTGVAEPRLSNAVARWKKGQCHV